MTAIVKISRDLGNPDAVSLCITTCLVGQESLAWWTDFFHVGVHMQGYIWAQPSLLLAQFTVILVRPVFPHALYV